MTWKQKVDDDNNPVFEDNKPVYIDPDGNELALDPPALYQKVTSLGKENKTHREKYQSLQDSYKMFDGIEDINEWYEKASTAMETVENFNDKDYMKASKVEELKSKIKSDFEEKLAAKDMKLSEIEKTHAEAINVLDGKIRNLMVSGKFASSRYFAGDSALTNLTPEIAESFFGKNFKVEDVDGELRLRAYYPNGDIVLSKLDPGEPADFEEAMGFIIDAYPGKDSILKSSGAGSGGSGGSGSGSGSDDSDLGKLKKQYEEAKKAGNMTMAVALKNRIFALEQKLRATG